MRFLNLCFLPNGRLYATCYPKHFKVWSCGLELVNAVFRNSSPIQVEPFEVFQFGKERY